VKRLAEEVGFEPTEPCGSHAFPSGVEQAACGWPPPSERPLMPLNAIDRPLEARRNGYRRGSQQRLRAQVRTHKRSAFWAVGVE